MDWEAVEIVCSVEFWRMAILWTLSLLYSYLLLVLKRGFFFVTHRPQQQSYSCNFLGAPIGAKPVCVITGATSGLGAAAAKALAAKGYCVVLGEQTMFGDNRLALYQWVLSYSKYTGRSPHLLSKIIEEIMKQLKDAQLREFVVDLSSIHSIMGFKNALEQWLSDSNLHPSVQLLINNAGMLATSCRVTADGYDQVMGTNFMGAFALTNLLLPLLKNSPLPSRIVNVTSFTHRCVSSVQVDKGNLVKLLYCAPASKGYRFARTYEYSKFYLLLFTYELHRKLYMNDLSRKVTIIAADPGVVETKIMRELPECIAGLAFTVLRHLYLLQTPENGVGSVIDAALAPPEASGLYFFGGKGRTIKSSALSYDKNLAEDAWSISYKLFREAQAKLIVDGDFQKYSE